MHGFDFSVPQFSIHVRGMCIVVTPNVVSDVLHVLRIAHPDYLGCERPFDWGDRQFTPCSSFTKGPQFLNMVMTFVLYPLSHYNSITEPRARFLLSLLKHLTIDFSSHFILSILDVYRDSVTRDKLIFPLVITRILRHFSISFPMSDHFHVMCAIDVATVKRSKV